MTTEGLIELALDRLVELGLIEILTIGGKSYFRLSPKGNALSYEEQVALLNQRVMQ